MVLAIASALRRPELPLRALAACAAWCFGVRKDMRAALARSDGVVQAGLLFPHYDRVRETN